MEAHKRTDGARTKAATKGEIKQAEGVKIGGEWKFQKNPAFLKERVDIWTELHDAQKKVIAGFPHVPIKITMPDGAVREGVSFETTPFDIASQIHKKLAEQTILAKVKYGKRVATLDDGLFNPEAGEDGKDSENGEGNWWQWDVNRPFEGDCELKLVKFDDESGLGKETFWHSSAHILGQTLENEFGVKLCIGPPTSNGFYYDAYTGKDIFTDKNYADIEKAAKKIYESKQAFERLVLSKEEGLRLFGTNAFKVQLIQNKIPDGGKMTAYRCGTLIDLCTGPHIPSTKVIKAFKITKNSAANWLGKTTNDSLQRVYGITFPTKDEMKEYLHIIEEAAKRDHRLIGRKQGLFDMHPLTPGCSFFYPRGTHIYNTLSNMIREQYRFRGYQEVISPNIFNLKLWKTSGHYAHYKDNLFLLQVEGQGFGMKPMNCPAHCLMFGNQNRSHRDLPLRYADFGVLHRNEISGALSGLTRVRRFVQDDAHSFCMPSQIGNEVLSVLDFLNHIYGLFGFKWELELSTRPEKRLGSEELWDQAEAALTTALNTFGKPWKENPGDGAFYGPKIDIKVYDALKRAHQCGTVQLDFQLPIRFNLQYKTSDVPVEKTEAEKKAEEAKLGSQLFKADEYDDQDFEWKEQVLRAGHSRPVMIHRAVLGSVERFMAILTEHTAGKWPFFLSPRQAIVCPISEKSNDYCESVYLYLHKKGWQVELDTSNQSVPKKCKIHSLDEWNFILIAGQDEAQTGEVDIRTRDNKRMGKMRVDELHAYFESLMPHNSTRFEQFYEKAWDPANFNSGCCAEGREFPAAAGAAKGATMPAAKVENLKVNVASRFGKDVQMLQVAADIVGSKLEINENADVKASPTGVLPFAETDKAKLSELSSIALHLGRMKSGSLLGKSVFQAHKVEEWLAWSDSSFAGALNAATSCVFNGGDAKKFNEAVNRVKQLAQALDKELEGKKWILGDSFSLADLYIGAQFATAFQTLFAPDGFGKAAPNLVRWFADFCAEKSVVARFGVIKSCTKPYKVGASEAKAAPAKKEEDDLDDLFGDDDEDDKPAKKVVVKKKEKKKAAAMSLVMLEVKPLDSETNLDDLAQKIFKEVTNEKGGLFWKTEYKKEPVAFGIYKLIIGFSCEDDNVSVDGIVEKVEAYEDLVQSVEIAAFNKI